MKLAFGSRRKPRKVQVDEDDGGAVDAVNSANTSASKTKPVAFRKSNLRQSIAFDEIPQSTNGSGTDGIAGNNVDDRSKSKSTIGGSNSTTKKKRPTASRLSFGLGEVISGDAAEALEDYDTFTPKKATLGRRVIESNAIRKSLPHQGLPMRLGDDDGERPTYSKDYLNELKSSTPSTPRDMGDVHTAPENKDTLDISELEGAVVVDTSEKTAPGPDLASIPSEAEIREKKERRARLAHEQDFISLDDNGDDRRQLSLFPKKKKAESRLVREDEDLGEGFDEFVDDGRISLGKKQEREAKHRQRKEMADMIQQAEGSSDEDSDDSEAERRAAYEAAQTRAGMDGLNKAGDDEADAASQIPSRITQLPSLSECLERLQSTIGLMEQGLAQRHKKMADLEQEKREILARESEVQELLKQAGARYSALSVDSNGHGVDPQSTMGVNEVVDRGLETIGNTPTTRPEVEDVG